MKARTTIEMPAGIRLGSQTIRPQIDQDHKTATCVAKIVQVDKNTEAIFVTLELDVDIDAELSSRCVTVGLRNKTPVAP